ncbi:MAG: hypothetical protein U1E25_01065 [Methylocystis sp.]
MTRRRLPNRRCHEVRELDWNGLRWTLGVGLFPDGRVAEVFALDRSKSAPAIEAVVRDATIIASIALQCGAPLETLRSATTRNPDGSAASAAGAILDLLAEGAA